jgi:radical SAM superfamily enzyme YgiQ (UPF0313 family)
MREKHIKQLLREEYGSLYKPGGSVRVALVFPNSYYLGMSNLGFQVILDEINRHPDASCERVFFSGVRVGTDLIPRSFETQRPLSEFDIIGFSVSFELDYFNVVKILYAAKIHLRAKDRSLRDPLIIAGGICPSFNPEPLSGFIDVFVIGDGEELVYNLLSEYQDWRQTQARPRAKRRNSRQDLLHRLSRIEGVYAPLLYDVSYKENGTLSGIRPRAGVKSKIERFSVSDLDKLDTTSKILTPNTEFASSFLVEVTRGCAHRCRFCVASYVQRCRMKSRDTILRLAQSELAQSAEKIGLVGSSVTDHPQIDAVATSLVGMGSKISIASMRADSVSGALLDALAASGKETITLAPEAASERLRRVIGKNIPLETVFEVIRSALKKGILNIKLYFMIGLPTETQKDVDNIVTAVERARKLMFDLPRPQFPLRKEGRGIVPVSPRLTISISPFVPKPHTPFQWCQMEDVKTLSQKLQFLRRKLGKIGGVRVPFSSARWSAVQGVLARGDRRLVDVLCDISQKSVSWNWTLKKNGLSQDFYLQRPRQLDELFPWDHLNLGVSRVRLMEQFSCHLAVS